MKIYNLKNCFLYYKEGICLYERVDTEINTIRYNLILRISYSETISDTLFFEMMKLLSALNKKIGKILFLAKEKYIVDKSKNF